MAADLYQGRGTAPERQPRFAHIRRPSARITRGGDLNSVLAGLDAAEAAGFPPPKINCVIMRGVNDAEILDFAEMTRTHGNSIRFIEYMPAVRGG